MTISVWTHRLAFIPTAISSSSPAHGRGLLSWLVARRNSKHRSVCEDGETLIRPYRKGTGSRYEKLFEIPYACVKQTSHDLIVNIRLPRKLGIRRIVTMMSEIFVAVTAFVGGM